MDWDSIAECCSPCCYKKKPSEVPYKSPKDALASVITPDMTEGLPMTKSVHLQQPTEILHPLPKASSDVMVITQQPKGPEESTLSPLHPSSLQPTRKPLSRSPSTGSSTSDAPPIFPTEMPSTSLQSLKIKSPSFQMAVTYYPEKQQLCVHTISYQLQGSEEGESSEDFDNVSTYLVLQIQPNIPTKLHSKVRTGLESRAILDEVFVFPDVPAMEVRYKMITVHIYKKATEGQPDLLGEVKYPLAEADITGTITLLPIKLITQKSEPKEHPEILVSLSYKENERRLQGLVLKAKHINLPSTSDSENVMVLVKMKEGDKRGSKKWNSSGNHTAPNPVFNQKFQFSLSTTTTLQDVNLTVVLVSSFGGSTGRGDPLGMVQIGQNVGEAESVKLWESVLSSPNQQSSRWLPLSPCIATASSTPLTLDNPV